MLARIITALLFVAISACEVGAEENAAQIRVGDTIFIRITGELAREYALRSGASKDVLKFDQLSIETTAIVEQSLDAGRFRIESSAPVNRNGEAKRLLTLTAVVESGKIVRDFIPKRIAVYGSPADVQNGKPFARTESAANALRVELSELKDVKLRLWTLTEEIGH